MIAFDTATRYMTVELAGAVATNQCQWISSWEDRSAVGTDFGITDDDTPVTVVPAPADQASGTRKLSSFSLFNNDTAAVAVTVTYRDSDGSEAHVLQSFTLQSGESLSYEQNSGWSGLDTNGNTKVASNTVQVSTALSLATVASSAASNATASNASQSTSLSAVSSMASQALSVGGADSTLASQALSLATATSTAVSTLTISELVASSVASRVKSSFLW